MAVHPLNPKFKDLQVSLGTYSRFEKGDTIHIALPNDALVKPVPISFYSRNSFLGSYWNSFIWCWNK